MSTETLKSGVTRKHVLLALACLVVCGVLLVLLRVMFKKSPPSVVYDALERLIQREHVTTVDIREFTDFNWDYLYVFPPYYTGDAEVSSVLGTELVVTREDSNVGDVLVVFMHVDKVVYYEFFHPKFRFIETNTPLMILRDNAIFKVAAEDMFSGGPYRLEQIEGSANTDGGVGEKN